MLLHAAPKYFYTDLARDSIVTPKKSYNNNNNNNNNHNSTYRVVHRKTITKDLHKDDYTRTKTTKLHIAKGLVLHGYKIRG